MPKTLSMKTITAASDAAARAIPPVWPLASSVAVNPYLGQTGETLAEVGARLGRVAGVPVTMPREVYLARIADGTITDQDILDAIAASADAQGLDLDRPSRRWRRRKKSTIPSRSPPSRGLPPKTSGIDWPGIIDERFGHWAAGYFDQGQALWAAPRRRGAYDAWRQYATHDLTPEIAGPQGLRAIRQRERPTPPTRPRNRR
jgi:uncharacterized protein YbcC (UPF0753/DUF2309 family)